MAWTVCFIAAVAVFLCSVGAAILIGRRYRGSGNRFITPFHSVFAGVFAMTFLLMLPVVFSLCEGTQLRVLKTVLFAIQGTFQVFTIDAETAIITENVTSSVGAIAPAYSAVLSVLFVVAPLFTFGFLASFFQNVSASFAFLFERGREMFVFSELNERSVTLASDIRAGHPAAAIVFSDVFENNEERSYELAERAKELGGICFKKDILSVNWKLHKKKKPLCFFLIGADESENIGQALTLIRRYGDIPDSRLYVFTRAIEGELLLSHQSDISMKVRRVDEVRSLIDRLLYERGDELFRRALPIAGTENEKMIHAVIVGLGAHGTEMLKALAWYCQMDGYRIVIDAFDRDPLSEERFTAMCPELMSEDYNGVTVPGEAAYTIRVHAGMDAESATFARCIGGMKDVSYAFVAVGTDERDIAVAAELRMLFERSGIHPAIHALVRHSDGNAALAGITNFRGQPYDIECVGDPASCFSEAVILRSDLENDALRRHLKWGREEDFWRYEYNFRSSLASAIHIRARIACGIPGAGKTEEQLTEEERGIIEPLEHRRWNAYMRAEGYIYSGSPDKSSRNDLGKMHHDLVDFSSLTEEEKRKDSRVGSL